MNVKSVLCFPAKNSGSSRMLGENKAVAFSSCSVVETKYIYILECKCMYNVIRKCLHYTAQLFIITFC